MTKHHYKSSSSSYESEGKATKLAIKLFRKLLSFECTRIKTVPFTITKSGIYCINKDLTYNGPGAAITALADNVTIKSQATITTTDTTSIGILVDGPNSPNGSIKNFKLVGGVYQYVNTTRPTTPTCNGLRMIGVTNANISSAITIGYAQGISSQLCTGGSIRNCVARDVTGNSGGIGATAFCFATNSSNGIVFDSCLATGSIFSTFLDTPTVGIALRGTSEDITVLNCEFPLCDAPIVILANNIVFKNCNASLSPSTGFNCAQMGASSSLGQLPANNVQFINCNFRAQTDPTFAPDGILFELGSNCLIQGCTLNGDTNPAGFDTAIHIGVKNAFGVLESFFSDVKIIDMVVNGPNEEVLFVDSGANITVDNLVAGGVTVNGIHLLDAQNVTIKNSDIQGAIGATGTGILVESSSHDNTIADNTIRNFRSGPGIHIEGNVNVIRDNNIYSNKQGIIIDDPNVNPAPQNNIEFNNPPVFLSATAKAPSKRLKSHRIFLI